MTKRSLFVAAAVILATAFSGINLMAQSSGAASRLVGKWAMVSSVSDGTTVEWMLEIKLIDGALTGTVSGEGGPTPAKDFKVDGAKVSFKTTYQDQDYQIDLELTGEKLTGKWTGDADSGSTVGTLSK